MVIVTGYNQWVSEAVKQPVGSIHRVTLELRLSDLVMLCVVWMEKILWAYKANKWAESVKQYAVDHVESAQLSS